MYKPSGEWRVAAHGSIQTDSRNKKLRIYKADDDSRRIALITRALLEVIHKYNPRVIVSEQPSGGGKSSCAVKGMAFATAIVTCVSTCTDIPLVSVTAAQSKHANCGDAKASKLRMQQHVADIHPEVAREYESSRSKTTGYKGEFEDIADAICAVYAAKADPTVMLCSSL